MAIFPTQIPAAEYERLCRLRDGLKRNELQDDGTRKADFWDTADKKANVVRPPLAKALSEELRRFAKDEDGTTFIDWAITISVVSMAVGFFIPDLWALFGDVVQGVTNEVDNAAFLVKFLR